MGRDIDVTWDTNTDDGTLKRKIKKLEDNNKQLRDPLKVAYAEVYKKIYVKNDVHLHCLFN
ncbi:hypothetical protein C6370_13130 [Bacillus atrophaeus]|nr:hypothetical protein C6370_13130 [Bacillus atrophaeus]